ncbi:hypothetical protein [Streptomyces sp. TLI_171]|uniref:hypothetical protein n=1 Tax=Streptomyces sp. TLI_171 TaxID=1938859 RepID=UPI000C1959F7|nr:hypothetical protein [Streptomyces sp. TLI_171]RKE05120.1 hypothetical protein BX266_7381 [Streptomyces sp. TLI_171]
MTVSLAFGQTLARLLDHRGLAPGELAAAAGVPAAKVSAVLDGGRPTGALLRRLGPALGLRTAHLFVLAEMRVPADLLPLDAKAGERMRWIVFRFVCLPPADRADILRLARSLPQQERTTRRERPLQTRWQGPGGKVVRMALHSNLGLFGLAYTLMAITESCLSPSTYHLIGQAEEELTPGLVADLAVLLEMDPEDLSALTGIALPEQQTTPAPETVDAVALIWEAHRLTAAQTVHIEETVKARVDQIRSRQTEVPQD